jgi:hypothetical protein
VLPAWGMTRVKSERLWNATHRAFNQSRISVTLWYAALPPGRRIIAASTLPGRATSEVAHHSSKLTWTTVIGGSTWRAGRRPGHSPSSANETAFHCSCAWGGMARTVCRVVAPSIQCDAWRGAGCRRQRGVQVACPRRTMRRENINMKMSRSLKQKIWDCGSALTLLAFAGCSFTPTLTVSSTPGGAYITEGARAFGIAPVKISYNVKELVQHKDPVSGCWLVKGLTAHWVSGTIASVKAD